MKALSLTQPWAWIVLYAGKRIENRTWNTQFRGRFLIHASKGMTRDQYEDALQACRDLGAPSVAKRVPPMADLLRGGIVGVDTLALVNPPCRSTDAQGQAGLCRHGWHMPGQYGFALVDVRPVPFVPCAGALGFWNADHLNLPEHTGVSA